MCAKTLAEFSCCFWLLVLNRYQFSCSLVSDLNGDVFKCTPTIAHGHYRNIHVSLWNNLDNSWSAISYLKVCECHFKFKYRIYMCLTQSVFPINPVPSIVSGAMKSPSFVRATSVLISSCKIVIDRFDTWYI